MCRKCDDMANKGLKIFSAAGLLLIYLSVMMASSVSLMLCDCHSHHRHAHDITVHEHHCSCGGCHTSDFAEELVAEGCECSHDHSTDVELYTFSRGENDDFAMRHLLMPALVADRIDGLEAIVATSVEYGRYLLPPQSGVEKGSVALRAPPALV